MELLRWPYPPIVQVIEKIVKEFEETGGGINLVTYIHNWPLQPFS